MKRRWILHPFFLAVFPVLALFAANMDQFAADVIFMPALRRLAWTIAAWVVLSLALRNRRKAAVVVSLFIVLYFSFAHVVSVLPRFHVPLRGVTLSTADAVKALLALAFVAGSYLTFKTRSDLVNLTRVLNFASACMVLFPVVRIAAFQAKTLSWRYGGIVAEERVPEGAAEAPAKPPHIFYIILDGYSRADNLKEIYGVDTEPFLDFLRQKGFFVADLARSNYSHTRYSLASSLNMEYLDDLARRVGEDSESPEPVTAMIKDCAVRRKLEGLGYNMAAFASGFYGTEIQDAALFLAPPKHESEFETGVKSTSPFLSDEEKARQARDRILYTFDRLPQLARSPQPLFVLAHVLAPHTPYLFARDGSPADTGRYFGLFSANHLINANGLSRSQAMRFYADQLTFLNSKVQTAVDQILSNSPVPPIIILQADHGADCFMHHTDVNLTYLQDRMSILSAYYVPEECRRLLYDRITPVNTFRLILRCCFGAQYELLADRSFYSSIKTPYKFVDVTDQIGSPADRQRYELLKSQEYYDAPTQEDMPIGMKPLGAASTQNQAAP